MSFGVIYNDTNFNLTLPSVLGSNRNGTTSLSGTFPTTSTGTSLGHYHYTEDITNSLKFLNASGTGSGGHQFWHSSSTQAPIKVLETNTTETLTTTQFNVDKSTAGQPILINLPNITISTNVVVVFASPINQAPWNIAGVGNPVQVLQNTANMVVGTTYYLTAFSTQLGQITTNADGTGIIDTTDLVNLPQPILTWESGQFGPSTIQTAILSDNLTITTQTDESILSATDLTFNNVSLQTTLRNLQITQTTTNNQYISAAIYADGRPPSAPTTTIAQQYAFTPSWYFKNTTAGYKINWYIGPNISMTVSNVLGLYMSIFNGLTTSNDNSPFIVCYTQPQSGDSTFYHSKRVFIFNPSIQPIANTRYFMYKNLSGDCPTPFHYGSTLINLETSNVVGSNVGPFLPSELILAFAIGTNSGSTINSVEFAVSKFGIMTINGTQELLFIQS
jgi:hypothetical protein